MSVYDQLYAGNENYFGENPHPMLLQFAGRIPSGGRVLDIGIGQGRNALPLARLGYRISGIDSSRAAIEQVEDFVDKGEAGPGSFETLWAGEFAEFDPQGGPFDAILVFGLMQILTRRECAGLIHRLHAWSAPGTVLMLTAWHVDDPLYDFYRTEWARDGLHSYRSADGQHRTFLARREILDLLPAWEVIHHREGLGQEHGHAGGQSHRHGEIELVAIRRMMGSG